MPTILGIESTAHTFGVAVVKNGIILSNYKRVFTTESGGMIPIEVAKFHFNNKNEIYFEALDLANIDEKSIDAIAFSQGPGLAPCLLEGMNFAKELASRINPSSTIPRPPHPNGGKKKINPRNCKNKIIPLVPVNHCIAHLEIGRLTGAKDPVMLYASGANTQIIAYSSGKYRIFGETLDIGVGNFIDTFGRYAGIGFPAGPKIQELASRSKNYVNLPYKVKGMDVALSGILTNLRQKLESKKYALEDLAFSLQETVFAMLVETAERAMAHTGKKELLLGGGVACNTRLQEMCRIMCKERGAKFFCPENQFLVDNAGMIAYLGEIMFMKKIYEKNLNKIDISPRERTDDVGVGWK